MAKGNYSNGSFLATDYTSITAADTVVEGDFESYILEVWDVKKLMIQGKTTGGNASATSDVVFLLVGRVGPSGLWDVVVDFTLTMTQTGTTQAVESGQIDVQGFHAIRLFSIENEDSSYTALVVNLFWGKAYGSRDW